MKNLPFYLRKSACYLWMFVGILQNDGLGYTSALASALFIAALEIERHRNERP